MGKSVFAIVGSYTREGGDGLSTYRVNDEVLTLCDSIYEGDPSFLDIHPTDRFLPL